MSKDLIHKMDEVQELIDEILKSLPENPRVSAEYIKSARTFISLSKEHLVNYKPKPKAKPRITVKEEKTAVKTATGFHTNKRNPTIGLGNTRQF